MPSRHAGRMFPPAKMVVQAIASVSVSPRKPGDYLFGNRLLSGAARFAVSSSSGVALPLVLRLPVKRPSKIAHISHVGTITTESCLVPLAHARPKQASLMKSASRRCSLSRWLEQCRLEASHLLCAAAFGVDRHELVRLIDNGVPDFEGGEHRQSFAALGDPHSPSGQPKPNSSVSIETSRRRRRDPGITNRLHVFYIDENAGPRGAARQERKLRVRVFSRAD